MSEIKETVKINKENENSYVIIMTMTERVNAKELIAHFDKIKEAHDTTKSQLDEIPKQVESRQKYFESQLATFTQRIEAFSKPAETANNYLKKEAEKAVKHEPEGRAGVAAGSPEAAA
jgi:uncharacterized protein YukE